MASILHSILSGLLLHLPVAALQLASFGFTDSTCRSGYFLEKTGKATRILTNSTNCRDLRGLNSASSYTGSSIDLVQALRGSTLTLDSWLFVNASELCKSGKEIELFAVQDSASVSSRCRNGVKVILQAAPPNCDLGVLFRVCSKKYSQPISSPEISIARIHNKNGVELLFHHIALRIQPVSFGQDVGYSMTVLADGYQEKLDSREGDYSWDSQKTTFIVGVGREEIFDTTSSSLACVFTCLGSLSERSDDISMRSLRIYNETVNSEALDRDFFQGPPPTVPSVFSSTETIRQGGEVGDHSSDPSYYQTVIPVQDLPVLVLSLVDIDEMPFSFNYTKEKSFIRLSTVPNKDICLLYTLEGARIDSATGGASIFWSSSIEGFGLRVRPNAALYSISKPLCSLTFAGVDGVTGESSRQNASLSVFVSHVNRPPVPRRGQSQLIRDGVVSPLNLIGDDVDSSIKTIIIKTLPKVGTLLTANRTLITAGASVEYGNAAQISYLYSGSIFATWTPLDETVLVDVDRFQFILVDAHGATSVVAEMQLNVTSSVQAWSPSAISSLGPSSVTRLIAAGAWNVPENTLTAIEIVGSDASFGDNNAYSMIANISKIPQFGALYMKQLDGSLKILEIGDGLLLQFRNYSKPNICTLEVFYRGNPGYFSVPLVPGSSHAPDAFSYTVTVVKHQPTSMNSLWFDWKNRVWFPQGLLRGGTSVSLTPLKQTSIATVHSVQVNNVDSPCIISYANSWKNGYVKLATYSSGGPKIIQFNAATLAGVTLFDEDADASFIVVKVSSTLLGVTFWLTSSFIDSLEFSMERCKGLCMGSSGATRSLIFVAKPSVAEKALRNATFTSFIASSNERDFINITVYDGKGGECLPESYQAAGSLRSECHRSSIAIPIVILAASDFSETSTSRSTTTYDFRLKLVILCAIVIVVLVCVRCFCCRGRNICCRKPDQEIVTTVTIRTGDGNNRSSNLREISRKSVESPERESRRSWFNWFSRTGSEAKRPPKKVFIRNSQKGTPTRGRYELAASSTPPVTPTPPRNRPMTNFDARQLSRYPSVYYRDPEEIYNDSFEGPALDSRTIARNRSLMMPRQELDAKDVECWPQDEFPLFDEELEAPPTRHHQGSPRRAPLPPSPPRANSVRALPNLVPLGFIRTAEDATQRSGRSSRRRDRRTRTTHSASDLSGMPTCLPPERYNNYNDPYIQYPTSRSGRGLRRAKTLQFVGEDFAYEY